MCHGSGAGARIGVGLAFVTFVATPFGITVSWKELARRTIRESIDDGCLDLAAQLAYYLFLALFPAILFLLAAASFFPLQTLTDDN